MQPRDVDIMRRSAVTGLISEQSECYAPHPQPWFRVLNHDSRACTNAHLLDAHSRLNADDYAAFCWPALERLTAAKLVSDMSTAAAARGS